ncbi:response regulator [Halochromatium glycolicum]|uniref:response regulator n=1 Tax=Halochromatium glycolicum TaxID=85075 RepID=UPI00190A2F63|nr:response regulator [Halochromatium glycolicum]
MNRLSILVIDDDPDICWAIERLVRSRAHRVTCVNTGAEALARLQHEAFDRIILDAKLRDTNGMELPSRIDRIAPGVWIVLVSGYYYADDPAVLAALEQGLIRRFVAKPFSHQALLDALAVEGEGQRAQAAIEVG